MIYPIVKLGDPVLETKAAPVTKFGRDLRQLLDDMFESMYAAMCRPGGPQIGVSRRIAVIDVTFKEVPPKTRSHNPEIIHTEGRSRRMKAAEHSGVSRECHPP